MVNELHWTAEDHAAERAKIARGHNALTGWATWQRNPGIHTDFPPESSFVRAMAPPPTEEQAGARHVTVMPTDEEAERVDRILAHWRAFNPRYWKIVHVEYRTGGGSERKARRCGFSRPEYRKRLERVQIMVADALDLAARRGT